MDTSLLFENASVLLPEIVLAVGVMVLMMVDIGRRKQEGSGALAALSIGILALGMGASLLIWSRPPAEYLGGAVSDGFALSVRLVVLIAGIFGVLLSRNYLPAIERQGGNGTNGGFRLLVAVAEVERSVPACGRVCR